jgi:hypothetical protein
MKNRDEKKLDMQLDELSRGWNFHNHHLGVDLHVYFIVVMISSIFISPQAHVLA